ncbi:MAG: nuclear transport factor 2 family protein [Bacteroidales bacterium]|jgi:hypothetical protein
MDKKIILEFAELINKHDVEGMCRLMTDDHIFIDAYNNIVKGKDKMRTSWKMYFEWFPDYMIEISGYIPGKECSALFGFASGTYHNLHNPAKSNHFHLPAAWKAITENDKIKLWQVYADTKIPFEIIERNKTSL